MPTLKYLNCSIELSQSQQTLQEFGTTYGDGFVETFVPVPSKPQSFSIHLTSDKFIAPGISMYVFVDGVYQCNRNRQDLKLRKGSDSRSVVDFKVRQKEEKQKDGSMIAREWKFEKLNTVSADDAPDVCSSNVLDNIGCIEVLVLRCAGSRTAKIISAMNVDGANDLPVHPFWMDGQPRESDGRPMYDDRGPSVSGHNNSRPPPPIPAYHSPYAEAIPSHYSTSFASDTLPSASRHQHRPQSRYSEPTSPGARPTSTIPSGAFQYGSGPIPSGLMHGSARSFYHTRPASAVVANAPGVDPAWLNELLTKAVKRGVEEVRRTEVGTQDHTQQPANVMAVKEPPGDWLQSPFGGGTTWGGSQDGWNPHPTRDRSATRVYWNDDPEWDSQSKVGSWGAAEETQSDTWDTDETWGTKKSDGRKDSRWSKPRAPTGGSKVSARPASPATTRTRSQRHSSHHSSRRPRSKSRPKSSKWDEGPSSSSGDREGWIKAEASSDSTASWEKSDDTARPARSRSNGRSSKYRSKSRKPSHPSRSEHGGGHKSSRHRDSQIRAPSTRTKHVSSTDSTATPTVINAPAPIYQHPVHAPGRPIQQLSDFAAPPPSIAPPPPDWTSVVADKLRKHNAALSTVPPAPFGVAEGRTVSCAPWDATKDKHAKTASSRSNSWGNDKKAVKTKTSDHADNDKSGWGNESVWNSGSAADVDAGWGNTKTANGGWDTDDNGWGANDTAKLDKQASKENNGWDTNCGKAGTTKQVEDAWTTRNDAWANESPKKNDTAWSTSPKPIKSTSTSKRHTSKSLSKYRQHSTAAFPDPKPHWHFPPPPTQLLPSISGHTAPLPPEPILKVSSLAASQKALSHHVRAGPGTSYGHAVARPEYLDTLESPYAVFRFKYRSRGVLGKMFGEDVLDAAGKGERGREREKDKLKDMSKEKLIEEMVKMQEKLKMKETEKNGGRKERKTESRATESVARDWTESWVRQQSREVSEKGKSKG
ncbi:hypothetical protein EK21DRAFT_37646, partial [Setomelanomma holmii]